MIMLLVLNLSLTICVGVIVSRLIYLNMETEKRIKDQIINARKDLNKLEQHRTVYLERIIREELEVTKDKVEDLREIITNSNENLEYEVKD